MEVWLSTLQLFEFPSAIIVVHSSRITERKKDGQASVEAIFNQCFWEHLVSSTFETHFRQS